LCIIAVPARATLMDIKGLKAGEAVASANIVIAPLASCAAPTLSLAFRAE
jgi:hypothetical protein